MGRERKNNKNLGTITQIDTICRFLTQKLSQKAIRYFVQYKYSQPVSRSLI